MWGRLPGAQVGVAAGRSGAGGGESGAAPRALAASAGETAPAGIAAGIGRQLKGVSLNTAGRRGSLPALGDRAGLGVLPR